MIKTNYQDYSRLPWGPLAAVIGSLLVYVVAPVVTIILLYAGAKVAGWGYEQMSDWITEGVVGVTVFGIILATVTLGGIWLFLKTRGGSLRDLGLVKPVWKDVLYALVGMGVYVVLYIILAGLLTQLIPALDVDQKQELGFSTDVAGIGLLIAFISLVILPPVTEEIVTRGFLYGGLRRKFRFWPAAIISAVLFGLAHLGGGEGGSTIWIAAIDTFVLALVLAYIRERRGSLWPAIGLHACKNFVAFLLLFVFKV